MKKTIALLLAIFLVVLPLAACRNSETGETTGRGTITETANTGKTIAWKKETDAAREELNATYQSLYQGTKAFAEVGRSNGTVYYISSKNGSNSNNGKSQTAAWKTCSKLESAALTSGDVVLFECGSVFREQIEIVSGITYSSYGTGAKPIFYGSINASGASKWSAVSGSQNLYCYSETISSQNDIGNICFDGGAAWGIKIQKLKDSNKTLALENVSNGVQTFEKIPSYAFSSGKDLKQYHLTYFHDPSGKLYLYCEGGNPGTLFKSIELSQSVKIFRGTDVSDVTICNLDFRYAGQFAIRTMNARNLTVKNCSFFFIGGSVQPDFGEWRNYETRLGNAIENWNGIDGMTVENCYFNQIYDTAMTTQSNSKVDMKNIVYRGNVVKNVWFGIELWAGDGNGGCHFENVDVSNNYFQSIGSGLTSQRPDKIENGVGIEGFIKISRGAYTVTGAAVTDNIIDGSIGRTLTCIQPLTDVNENGFLFDRNTYVNLAGNVFATLPASFPTVSEDYGASTKSVSYEYGKVKDIVSHGFEPNGTFYYKVSETDTAAAIKGVCGEFESRIDTLPLYTYTAENGMVIPFRLILPEGYSEQNGCPLIVCLNVEQACGSDNLKQVMTANVLMAKIASAGKSVLLVPQCPEGTWTGLPVNNGNYSVGETEESATMKAIVGLIADVAAKYKTAGNYAVGADAGGYAVADLLARHRDLLKKAIIISGAGDPAANIGDAKVRLIHAEFDQTIPFANAQALADAWGAEITKYPRGYLHDCWNEAYRQEDLLGWLIP